MADEKSATRAFWHIDIVGIVTFAVLLVGIGMSYQEIKSHEQQTKDALSSVQGKTQDFDAKVGAFIVREDTRAARQEQIDKDCPRHRHGKKGEIFYCGQQFGGTLDPPAAFSDEPAAVKPQK